MKKNQNIKQRKKKPSPAKKYGSAFNPYNENSLKRVIPKVPNTFNI
jgi:hypothetical protein